MVKQFLLSEPKKDLEKLKDIRWNDVWWKNIFLYNQESTAFTLKNITRCDLKYLFKKKFQTPNFYQISKL